MSNEFKGVMEGMKEAADKVRSQLGGNAAFLKRLNLSGAKAVVKPGGKIVVRLLPRWDYKDKFVKQGAQWVENPNYKGGYRHLPALEHWWDGEQNKRNRAWCPKTFDPEKECPICDFSEKLLNSPDQNDVKYGKGISKSGVFLFNCIATDPGTGLRVVNEKGEPDIKILCASNTIFLAIADIVTGGGDADYAFGDITNPKTGHDVKLNRPQTGGSERWTVDVNPKSTPLYKPEQKDIFAGWVDRLHDLPEWIKEELIEPEDLAKKFGLDTERPALPGGTAGNTPVEPASAPATSGAGDSWGLGDSEEEPPF